MAKVFDRLLLLLYSLLVGAVAIVMLLFGLKMYAAAKVNAYVNDVLTGLFSVRMIIIAVSSLVFLVSLRFIYISISRGRADVPSIDQRTDFGDIRISVETVENLSLKAAGRVRGIKDLKARVKVDEAGLEIVIRAIIDGETPIPHLTAEVQRAVKDYIEEITGIPVAYVSVFIANTSQSTTFKSRVE